MYTVYDLLRFQATVRPEAPFLILRDRVKTFGDIGARVEALRDSLRSEGVRRGDRVVVSCSEADDYVSAVLAIWALRAVVAPVEPSLPEQSRRMLLEVAQANWLVSAENGDPPSIERLEYTSAGSWPAGIREPAQLLFTSGSSGVPKAVILSHEAIMAVAIECADSLALSPNDVQMTTVPFWHAYGQNRGLNATLFAGASIAPVFDDDLSVRISELKRIRPTVLLSMASFYGFLAFYRRPLGDRLRVAVAGAAPLPTPVQVKFEELYSVPLLTTYGLTEFLLISCQRLADKRSRGGVGYPCRGVEVKITDKNGEEVSPGESGRILVRGCQAMEGYLGASDKKVSTDGWLDTEDIGALDHTGLRVLGRDSAFIKRSGYKVYPIEVQNVMSQHPEVVDVAVAKFIGSLGGEDLVAEVVLKEGSEASVVDLLEYCKEHLPDYKVPAKCRLVADIPRLPSGKPDLITIGKRASDR